MIKRWLSVLPGLLITLTVSAQITLEECYRLARENYPLVRQYGLIEMSEAYDLNNASKAWLPQFSLSGRATYQSDVTGIPISTPGYEITKLSKDQYQVVAEVAQVIWDGGQTRAEKDAVSAKSEVDRARFEVDMYALRDRIDNLYFGILLIDEQLRLNTLFLDNLQVNYDRVESYMENGIANQADLDAVRVEQLNSGQDRAQLEAYRTAYLAMLSAFTGLNLDENTQLVKPQVWDRLATGDAVHRPEMALYEAMDRQYLAQRVSIRATTMPQFGVFLQGGYGKPGLNTLQDKFKPYALGGLRLSWNFGNYYTRRNNLEKLDIGMRQVDVQRETFLFNNYLQQSQSAAQYDKYRKMIADDDEIIRMRQNVLRASEAKLENGIISVSDLVRDMISEQNSKVNKAVHEIEMLQTIYQIKNLTNE